MWDAILDAMGSVLALFYTAIPNYGVGIILLTVGIRLALYPMTAKQARSMAAMQRLQPEIKKIQQKYKNDRQKLNEELMAFYKEHQFNPLSGCLPMVAQIPIFFALFQVLRNAATHVPQDSALFDAFCPSQSPWVCRATGAEGLGFLSMDLSKTATNVEGLVASIPFWILVSLVIGSGFLQSRQMTRLQRGRSNPQSQMMTRLFPVIIGVFAISLPAGVVLYFLVSNVWQIGQQAVIFGKDDTAGVGAKGGERRKAIEASSREAKGKTPRGGDDAPAKEKGSPRGKGASEKTAADEPAKGSKGSPEGSQEKAGGEAGSGPARPSRSKSRKKKKRKRKR